MTSTTSILFFWYFLVSFSMSILSTWGLLTFYMKRDRLILWQSLACLSLVVVATFEAIHISPDSIIPPNITSILLILGWVGTALFLSLGVIIYVGRYHGVRILHKTFGTWLGSYQPVGFHPRHAGTLDWREIGMQDKEPIVTINMLIALIGSFIAVLVSLNLINITEDQQQTIMKFVTIAMPVLVGLISALIGRAYVTPVKLPRIVDEGGNVIPLVRVDGKPLEE